MTITYQLSLLKVHMKSTDDYHYQLVLFMAGERSELAITYQFFEGV